MGSGASMYWLGERGSEIGRPLLVETMILHNSSKFIKLIKCYHVSHNQSTFGFSSFSPDK